MRPTAACLFLFSVVFAAHAQEKPAASKSRPSILIFSQGFSCAHCDEQYQSYVKAAPLLKRYGVGATFIVPGGEATAGNAKRISDGPIKIAIDKNQELSRKYADVLKKASHGTLVLEPSGKATWSTIGKIPYSDVALVLGAALQTEITVEVEVNNTPTPADDYLTWAPTPARIRIVKSPENMKSITVVLTNDSEKPIPDGRDRPSDGNLCFVQTLTPGQTADQANLTLQIDTDGRWVEFYVAGQFLRPSSADKDAIIEMHLDKADGPLVGSKATMVRVRKNVDSLTNEERTAFLKALRDLQVRSKGYELFPRMHDLAAKGKEPYQPKYIDGKANPKYWPDQAHGGAGFLPWHRAFLLQIERELQQINPAVTIPYWRQNVKTEAFSRDFLGTNRSPFDGAYRSEVYFSPSNWLYGWSISYRNLKTVVRAAKDHSLLRVGADGATLDGDSQLFDPSHPPILTTFGAFANKLEFNPHNMGHASLGAWHNNCLISPSDPSFWAFHGEDDRLWAKWQWFHDRFDSEAGDGDKSYSFIGKFISDGDPKTVTKLGHNLKDTMWPWDGTTGQVHSDKDLRGTRPDKNDFKPFAKAPWSGLWPPAEATPMPADMIDYLGMSKKRLPHGFCYDDVPFGVRKATSEPLIAISKATTDLLVEVAEDPDTPFERRQKALQLLSQNFPVSERAFSTIANDPTAPLRLRQDSLFGLMTTRPNVAIDRLADATIEQGERGRQFRGTLVDLASVAHLASLPSESRERLHKMLGETMADDADPPLAARAAIVLATMENPEAIAHLKGLLKAKGKPPITRSEIAAALPPDHEDNAATILAMLEQAILDNDEDGIVVALRALAGDPGSRKRRIELIDLDVNAYGWLVKRCALRSVMREAPEVLPKALTILETTASNTNQFKLEAAGVLRVALESLGPFKPEELKDWKDRLQKVYDGVPDTAAEMKLALSMALEVFVEVNKK